MPHSDPKTLVSTDWLAARLTDKNVKILDASWYLPAANRNGGEEFEQQHISGARFFDIDEISDADSSLPHMVPPIEKFVSRVRGLGIGDGDQVVVYDGAGLMSAARVWWLFRLMGKPNIAVLDGGLPKWINEGREVTDQTTEAGGRHLLVQWQEHMVRDSQQILRYIDDHEFVDARPAARFRGEVPEPRAGLRSGHIPNSKNVPFNELLNADGTMKSVDEQRAIFVAAGVDLDKPTITTCGSGVTAAVLSLALERMGHAKHALYDGSWSEWGLPSDLPVETGE